MTNAESTKPKKPHDRWGTSNYMIDGGFNRFDLTATERLIWLAMYRHANRYGESCISDRRLKDSCNLSRPTIQKAIKGMEKKGALKIVSRKTGDSPSRYTMFGKYKSNKLPQGVVK
ncbi:MAG: helix-turn-helix domain-containing protein [Thermoguttaceae bacterium]